MSIDCHLNSNPDISGRGVRAAIYLQNILCFFPAFWALWDGKVTEYELDSVETHSMTNLILAFAILVSCIVQALGAHGLSNYHTSIILSMSWMNNTGAFIYFLLYVQYQTQEGAVAPRWSAWVKHLRGRIVIVLRPLFGLVRSCITAPRRIANRLFLHRSRSGPPGVIEGGRQLEELSVWHIASDAARVLFRRIAIVLGSLHLTVMATLGIWLWSAPQSFGTSDTDPRCAFNFADLTVLGVHIPFNSDPLRIFSLTIYSLFLVPGVNLLFPIVAFLWLHLTHRVFYPPSPPQEESSSEVASHLGGRHVDEGSQQPLPLSESIPRAPGSRRTSISGLIRSSTFPVYVGMVILLIINIVLIVDIELTLRRNEHMQDAEESQWGFGQILALFLVSMPLRDLIEAIFRRRQETQTVLDNALKKAIIGGDTEEVSRWIRAGAKPNVRPDNTASRTALDFAAWSKNWSLFHEIVIAGADVNARFKAYETALEVVTRSSQWQLLPVLINANADLDCQFSDGSGTVLHAACQSGPPQMVTMLLDRGADISIAGTQRGEPCIHVACSAGREEIVQILLERGANPNSRDRHGNTPLYTACHPHHQHIPTVILLLKHGAEPAPESAVHLRSIAKSLHSSFHDTLDPDGIILVHEAGLTFPPSGHAERAALLMRLADCLHWRSERAGSGPARDIEAAVKLKMRASKYLPPGSINRLRYIQSLTNSLRLLSQQTGSMKDFDDIIVLEREALELHSQGDEGRVGSICNLVQSLRYRWEVSGSLADIDEVIGLEREIVELRPADSHDRVCALRTLAASLDHRAEKFGAISDMEEAIGLKRDVLKHHPPDGTPVQDLESLALSLHHLFKRGGAIATIDEAIQLEREVLEHHPRNEDRRRACQTLAYSLLLRSQKVGSISDTDEAISLLKETLEHRQPDHPEYTRTLRDLAISLHTRFEQTRWVPNLEEAVEVKREVLRRRPPGHEGRLKALNSLSASLCALHDQMPEGGADYLEEVIELEREAEELGEISAG